MHKAQYYKLKKDKKIGLVMISPAIDWSKLSEEEKKIQWHNCLLSIWQSEKEGEIDSDVLLDKFYKFLESIYSREEIVLIKKVKEHYIPFTLLSVSYLLSTGAIYDSGIEYFSKNVKILIDRGKRVTEETITVVKKDRSKELAVRLIGEIQDLEDTMFEERVDFEEFFREKNISKDIGERVLLFFAGRIEEVFQIRDGKDEQLNESYAHLSKDQKNYMVKWYIGLQKSLDSIIKRDAQVIVRKSRPKTPEKIVKGLKYMSSSPELKIKSIAPEKIVSSSIVWVYNTKTRKLIIYASGDKKLSVEGTSIINYSEELSSGKTLRKPEVQLSEFMNGGKIHMRDYYKNIKSVGSPVSGRINRDMLILKVF